MNDLQLSESQLNGMAESADDVAEEISDASATLSDSQTPSLEGFDTAAALSEAIGQWTSRLSTSHTHWSEHASSLRRTAANVVKQDDDNMWYIGSNVEGY